MVTISKLEENHHLIATCQQNHNIFCQKKQNYNIFDIVTDDTIKNFYAN